MIEPEPVISGEQFDTYRYKLRTVGSYHEIAELLTNIASMPRIVAPFALQLNVSGAPATTKEATPEKVQLLANFQIQAYAVKSTMANSDAPPPPPPPKPGKKG